MECALLLLLLWVGRDSTAAGAGGSMASGIRLQLEGTTNYYEGRRLKIGLMLDWIWKDFLKKVHHLLLVEKLRGSVISVQTGSVLEGKNANVSTRF